MIDTVTLENDAGNVLRLTDYGLILKYFDAPEPDPKTYIESIEGADGDLDMTEWAGIVRYKNRDVEFGIRDMTALWWREIVRFCHGRNVKITHSTDPDHYYYGRCTVTHETRENVTDLEVRASCGPYRLCHMETVVSRAVTGSASIALESVRRPVTPSITVSAEMTISFSGDSATLPAGTYTLPDLILTDSPTTVTVTGTGTITFKWRDGDL